MFSKTSTTKSIDKYWDKILHVRQLLNNADHVLVGVASGLSAAGGINYFNAELTRKCFPEYYEIGLHSLPSIQSVYWELSRCKPEQYWGYWARHINYIRYEAPVTKPYVDLMKLLLGKNYFIASTNADGQLQKAGFSKEKIYAPQGDYCYFQCEVPCCDEVFYNEAMIKNMVSHMPNVFEIKTEVIPYCPKCGAHLIPNLRCDDKFVEKPHIQNVDEYEAWLNNVHDGRLLLLELGVGHQTPGIIRYPFEASTSICETATLVRVNINHDEVPDSIQNKAISIQADIARVLSDSIAR